MVLSQNRCLPCEVLKNATLNKVSHAGGLDEVVLDCVDIGAELDLAKKMLTEGSISQMVRFE